jgi:hypothetical protein
LKILVPESDFQHEAIASPLSPPCDSSRSGEACSRDREEGGRSAERRDDEGSIHSLASIAATLAETSIEFVAESQEGCKLFVKLMQILNQSRRSAISHRFRDTFAVELLLAGVPIERVSILMGHQSVRVTERHYNPWVRSRQEQLEAEVARTRSRIRCVCKKYRVQNGFTERNGKYLKAKGKGSRRGWDSNPRMEFLQTSPLGPLGYRAVPENSTTYSYYSIPYVRLAAKSAATFGSSLPRTRFSEMPCTAPAACCDPL